MVDFAKINKERKRIKALTPEQRLKEIADIISLVDQRCLAADGPVTATKDEITAEEIRKIWRLASE